MPRVSVDKKYYNALIKIGLNVAYYRKLNGLTQQQLADKIDVSKTTIANIESPDKFYSLSLATAFRLSDVFNITLSELFELRGEK